MRGRVSVAICHPLHAADPLLHQKVATTTLLGPVVLDILFEFLAQVTDRAVVILAALGVREDQEEEFLADLAVVASVPQPADLGVAQDALDGDAAW